MPESQGMTLTTEPDPPVPASRQFTFASGSTRLIRPGVPAAVVREGSVTIVKWVVPVVWPSRAVTVTWKVPGADGSVPVIVALVEFGSRLRARPGGRPVVLYCSAGGVEERLLSSVLMRNENEPPAP